MKPVTKRRRQRHLTNEEAASMVAADPGYRSDPFAYSRALTQLRHGILTIGAVVETNGRISV